MGTLSHAGSSSARRLLFLFVLALPLVALRAADTPKVKGKGKDEPSPALPSYVKNVDVSVTNLDVIVTDSKGNHVTGLTKDDFEVVEDGLKQSLSNFYAVDQGHVVRIGDEVVPTPPPAVVGVPAPPPPVEAPANVKHTKIVIFVDNLHLTPGNRNRVLKNVEAFVRDAVKGDVEGMIVTFNRTLKVRRKFTNDGRDLSDVLRQIEEESALGTTLLSDRREIIQRIDDSASADNAVQAARNYAESIANDLKFTIDAMKTTINQLSGIEGRKVMIHVSDGLPQSPGAEIWKYISDRFQYSGGVLQMNFEFDKTQSYLGVIQAANAAGVSMYTIDTTGLETDSSVTAENRTNAARLDTFTEKNNLQSMLSLMSEETGGKAILNKNDVTVALKEIEKDTTSYYSLGYRSLRSGADRPHHVDVKVLKKGLNARARKSYLEKSAETKVQEAVVSALYFPRDDNPLGIGIEVGTPSPADRANYIVPITIRVPYARIAMIPDGPKVRGRLVFYFMVVDVSGKESDLSRSPLPIEMSTRQFDQVAKQDFKYDVKLLMIPGSQKLSLAVRDEITNTSSYLQKSIFVSALN